MSSLSPAPNVAIATGTVINYNTIEEFKNSNKKALFAETADGVCSIATLPSHPSSHSFP